MKRIKILWVDDEIDLLKSHILFLETKGYDTSPCNNGRDAIDRVAEEVFDVVLLDENMPGLNGIETLAAIKSRKPNLPIIMVTKNEEEQIMEEAIGTKISDYLIKPVNPYQILSSLKKTLDHKSLIAEKTTQNYREEFTTLSHRLLDLKTANDWTQFYKELVFWELELETLEDQEWYKMFEGQWKEANIQFSQFIESHYEDWLHNDNGPILSHNAFQRLVYPHLSASTPTLLLVIDNLRLDQWQTLMPSIEEIASLQEDKTYFSLLPTATQYARNSFFAGLTPLQIQTQFPDWWVAESDEKGKNLHEADLLKANCIRLGYTRPISYHKIIHSSQGQQLVNSLQNHSHEGLTAVVYNFVDMISHAKTDMDVIKELASDNKAYRSLTHSWFKNSSLKELIKKAVSLNYKVILTTDHGTINVELPSSVIGDRETSMNLRYKTGKSLTYNKKDVYACNDPKKLELPSPYFNTPFIFAKGNRYFVYKNNYNHYVKHFKNTYQHGGISMEEMILPFVVLR